MTVGERIKLRREALGITQVSLADTIGEKKQTLYKYENNLITNIPIENIELIAKALHTTPAYLMGWDDSPLPAPVIAPAPPLTTNKEQSPLQFTSEEIALIQAYRRADDRARQMVDLALDPYKTAAQAEEAM